MTSVWQQSTCVPRSVTTSRFVALVFVLAWLFTFAMDAYSKPQITKASFGKTKDGKQVDIYTLTNSRAAEARIITYGGAVVSLKVPDKNGKLGDVVLGFDSIADYERHAAYFGALVGRYGNRIARGKFTLDGHEYLLATNNGENHLHGGLRGFDASQEVSPRAARDGDGIEADCVVRWREAYAGERLM